MYPKCFISHAGEDKEEFARPLATRLRELGVEAWYDEWELQPGDRLVDKIFEKGLGEADAVAILLSNNSAKKDWVVAEYETAVVLMIERGLRLIPVLLDDCEIPISLKRAVWIDLDKVGGIENTAQLIAKTLFGKSDKPPLGKAPIYINYGTLREPGLSKIDCVVLELAFHHAVKNGRKLIQHPQLFEKAEELGISHDDVRESMEVLTRNWLERANSSSKVVVATMPASLFLTLAEIFGVDIEDTEKAVAVHILNGIKTVNGLIEQFTLPAPIIEAIVDQFVESEYILMGGAGAILRVRPTLKRWVEDD